MIATLLIVLMSIALGATLSQKSGRSFLANLFGYIFNRERRLSDDDKVKKLDNFIFSVQQASLASTNALKEVNGNVSEFPHTMHNNLTSAEKVQRRKALIKSVQEFQAAAQDYSRVVVEVIEKTENLNEVPYSSPLVTTFPKSIAVPTVAEVKTEISIKKLDDLRPHLQGLIKSFPVEGTTFYSGVFDVDQVFIVAYPKADGNFTGAELNGSQLNQMILQGKIPNRDFFASPKKAFNK